MGPQCSAPKPPPANRQQVIADLFGIVDPVTARRAVQLVPHDAPAAAMAQRVSAGCYGSIVAASTLAGSARVPPGGLALLVVATNLVYFSTHVFAYSIGDPNVEGKHLPQVAAHHARLAAPMVSTAFLPLVVVLVLEILGADHQRATSAGVITAAGLLVVVGLPGAYLHGVHGWGLALLTVVILAMTTVLVLAKLWLTH
jgi:hypothetical protein